MMSSLFKPNDDPTPEHTHQCLQQSKLGGYNKAAKWRNGGHSKWGCMNNIQLHQKMGGARENLNNDEGPLVVRGTTTDKGKPSTTQRATDSDDEHKE
ncbi:hypothetical protein L208DRAFT_1393267 [Tricholoma matsutake]|nr:hypothetical protein L208DRAFT_1393267 [Tricholoma matsutake 945]